MRFEAEFIPYDRHVTPEVIQLKRGGYVTMFRACGATTQFNAAEQLAALHERRAITTTTARNDGWTMHYNVLRLPSEMQPEGTPTALVPHAIDQAVRSATGRMFENQHYLSIVRHPGLGPIARQYNTLPKKAKRAQEKQWLKEIDEYAGRFAELMLPFGLERLTCVDGPQGGWISEPLSVLAQIVNAGFGGPLLLADHDIDAYIPRRRKLFKADAIAAGDPGGNTWGTLIGIEHYATPTRPTCFDGLLQLPFSMVLSQSFSPMHYDDAKSAISWKRQHYQTTAGEDAEDLLTQLNQDARDLVSGDAIKGLHHFSVCPLVQQAGEGEAGAKAAVMALSGAANAVIGALAGSGIVAKREVTNAHASFYAQLPGAFLDAAPRRAQINSRNWASYCALNAVEQGSPRGNHWGSCIAVFPTMANGPYAFNFHHADLGIYAIFGKPGEGKTLLAVYLMLMSLRLDPVPRIIHLDKDASAEVGILAAGGHYQRITPGLPVGWNPYDRVDSPAVLEWLIDATVEMLIVTGMEDTADHRETVERAVRSSQDMARRHATIDGMAHFLPGIAPGTPGHAAKPWIAGGRFHWLFGAEKDTFDLTKQGLIGIDLTEILSSPLVSEPALRYLIHRIRREVNGQRLILNVEESWNVVRNATLAGAFDDLLKTIRKFDGIVGFTSQQMSSLARSFIGDSIKENRGTMICTPNPSLNAADCREWDLTEEEIAAIKAMPEKSRQFFVKTGERSAVINANLSVLGPYVELLATTPEKSARLATLREAHGDDPAAWVPYFIGEKTHVLEDTGNVVALYDAPRVQLGRAQA